MTLRPGWKADCPQCVASKFTCDRHHVAETISGASPSAHTPGPWAVSGVRQKVDGRDSHSVIGSVDGKEIILASVCYNPRTHEGFHDARLIAAAPDLLRALGNLAASALGAIEGLADNDMRSETLERCEAEARAAIAKATGQADPAAPPPGFEQWGRT